MFFQKFLKNSKSSNFIGMKGKNILDFLAVKGDRESRCF